MVTIVIPSYNEEKRIGKTIRRIIRYMGDSRYEIIVVDDGSDDRTREIVEKEGQDHVKLIRNKTNKGKGYSVKKGIREARYPLVLFSDSDLATPIEELEKLKDYIREHDIAIASRYLPGSDIRLKQPLHRRLMARCFRFIVNVIAVRGFKDTQCGFKLFRTDVAKEIISHQRLSRYSFDVEILFIAKKKGYRITEVPVVWIDQAGSKVNPVKDSLAVFFDLFRIRINDIKGRYGGKRL